jgi:hypothetical protein
MTRKVVLMTIIIIPTIFATSIVTLTGFGRVFHIIDTVFSFISHKNVEVI